MVPDDPEAALSGVADLTERELEVLRLLESDMSRRQIAEELYLAHNTVKTYVGKILGKLYVKNRRQAVERAKKLGLLDLDRKASVMGPHGLPAEPTPFIGRAEHLAEVRRLLAETRLLTLVGAGGIGKTRLALQAASDALDGYAPRERLSADEVTGALGEITAGARAQLEGHMNADTIAIDAAPPRERGGRRRRRRE